MTTITIPTSYPRKNVIETISSYAKVSVEIKEDSSCFVPELVVSGTPIIGIPSIIIHLIKSSKVSKTFAKDLLGEKSKEDFAKITQYVELAENVSSGKSTISTLNLVGQISTDLKYNTFLVGTKITIADIIMYFALYDEVAKISADQNKGFSNIIRWMDHIHYLIKDPLPNLKFTSFFPFSIKEKNGNKEEDKQKDKEMSNDKKKEKPVKEKPKKEKPEKEKPKKPEAPKEEFDPASYIDVRIGKIIHIEPHPQADGLYKEEIDIGGGVIKNVITGVRKFIPIEQMQDRHVVVFCNIKPSKIRGLPSNGMVFAGSNPEKTIVELLDCPKDTPIGTRVLFGDFCKCEPAECDKKGKLWEAVVPHCKINADGVATYKDQPLHVPQGNLTVPTLRNCEFH